MVKMNTMKRIEPVVERIVETVVNRKLQQLLQDPDYGMELREGFKKKLHSILKNKQKTISGEAVAKKYGVNL